MTWHPHRESLKISLFALLGGLVLTSIIATTVIQIGSEYHSEREMLYATALDLNEKSAKDMSATIGALFHSMKESLEKTSGFLSQRLHQPEFNIHEQLELIRNSSNFFNSIAWVDESGVIRNSSPAILDSDGRSIIAKEEIKVLREKKYSVSAPYLSHSGQLIVLFTSPMFDREGVYRGFVAGTIYWYKPNVLTKIFESTEVRKEGSHFYIISSDGRLLFHPDQSRLGEKVRFDLMTSELLQGQSGKMHAADTEGSPFLAGYAFEPESGWGVIVQSDAEEAVRKVKENLVFKILFVLPALMVMLFAAGFLARKLSEPFVMLSKAVKRLSEGNTNVHLPFAHHWNLEANQLSQAVNLAIKTMENQTTQLSHEAMTDPLTGLLNRRGMETLTNRWAGAGRSYAVIMTDVDHFKQVNDEFGHQTGDQTLIHIAKVIKSVAGQKGNCCRYGGEEFIVLLPGFSESKAYHIAESIRTTIEELPNPTGRKITVSLGVAEYPAYASTPQELLSLADLALYKAKKEGRNMTMVASQPGRFEQKTR